MREDIIGIVLGILLIITIIGMIIIGTLDNSTYYYECTNINGNTIYCERVDNTQGGLIGIIKDRTKVIITSYKKVVKEGE